MTRVGVFVSGGPSPFGDLLKAWVNDKKHVVLFADGPDISDDFHYLRFAQMHEARPFDLLIYDVVDDVAHAALYPLITKYPGVLFCNDIRLWDFARAVSHEARDPWGTGRIFKTAALGRADELTEMALSGSDPSSILDNHPLAVALGRTSVGMVVADQNSKDQLAHQKHMPNIEVVPSMISEIEFASFMVLQIPVWAEATKKLRDEIKPVEHPFRDLYAVELGRIMERYGDGPQDQLNRALECLRDLFEGATNSATAEKGESE